MSTTHTPGPWSVCNNVNSQTRENYYTVSGDGSHIANLSGHHANARLIAAAPDLLTALRNLEDAASLIEERWSSGDLADAVRSLIVDRNAARTAIAAATEV